MTKHHHPTTGVASGAHFDVFVTVPQGASLDEIRERAIHDVHIPQDKVDDLIRAFAETPRVKIRSEVTLDKAEKARLYFTQAGLKVSLVPVLGLEDMVESDGTLICPACGARVKLNARRECPNCGAVVPLAGGGASRVDGSHKKDSSSGNSDAALLDAKRGRAVADGSLGGLSRQTLVSLIAAVVLLMVASYGTGYWRADQAGKETLAELRKAYGGTGFDALFAKLGSGSGQPAGEADAGWLLADPKDSLFTVATGGPMLGETPQELQMSAGWLSLGGLDPYARTILDPEGKRVPSSKPGDAAGGNGTQPILPAPARLALGIKFVQALAEMGQFQRAREVIRLLRPSAADAGSVAILMQLDLEARARGLAASPGSLSRALVESLRTDILALPDPVARALTLARVAATLAEAPGLPPEAHLAFFMEARVALASLSNEGQRSRATGAIQVAAGRALMAESVTMEQAGAWARVRVLSTDIGTLVDQAASRETAIKLLALDLRARSRAGSASEVSSRLVKALALVEDEPLQVVRANLLRVLAEVPSLAGHERFQAAVERLEIFAEAQPGPARAKVYTSLALASADAGMAARFAAYRQKALETGGLNKEESVLLHAELVASGDIAVARQLHASKAYAESESRIRRIASYLL